MNNAEHIKILLDSFAHYVGRELIERKSISEDLETIESSDFVVVSHGTQDDPVFNYANPFALKLWEMDFEKFTSLPSKYSAEPTEREMRDKLLKATKKYGFYDKYEGVRISSNGARFKIKNVIVWNLIDADGKYYGQAATFKDITHL